MERFLEFISKTLGMCGNGPPNNLWVRFAELFFVNCPCCIFWRGFVVGGLVGGTICLMIATGLALAGKLIL